jgi:hypothetical protein
MYSAWLVLRVRGGSFAYRLDFFDLFGTHSNTRFNQATSGCVWATNLPICPQTCAGLVRPAFIEGIVVWMAQGPGTA